FGLELLVLACKARAGLLKLLGQCVAALTVGGETLLGAVEAFERGAHALVGLGAFVLFDQIGRVGDWLAIVLDQARLGFAIPEIAQTSRQQIPRQLGAELGVDR